MASNGTRSHDAALWAGLTALFSNLAAVSVIDLFGTPDKTNTAIAAVITSFIIGASVYSKTRWDNVKAAERRNGNSTTRPRPRSVK